MSAGVRLDLLPARPVVLKFGGSSLATPGRVRRAAARVRHHQTEGSAPVVVASAAGRTTDRILARLEAVALADSPAPARVWARDQARERDRALLSGEDRSAALLAAALLAAGVRSRSLTAAEAGLRGRRGRLPTLDPGPILRLLHEGIVPVVGGFQAEDPGGERITLDRGGSDLVAVLLAAHLRSPSCILVKDVAGVHADDPATAPESPLHPWLSWTALESLAQSGARVIQAEAARQARRHRIPLHFIHFRSPPHGPGGTHVGAPASGGSPGNRPERAAGRPPRPASCTGEARP